MPTAPRALSTLSLASLLCLSASTAWAHPGPDGEVRSHHNEVETRPKAEMDWQPAAVGQEIFKNGRVVTRDDSRAAVNMRDTSTVSLRENTLLIIYGHHAERNKKIIAMEATLETGALRSRLGDLSGGQRARIETPSATVTQEGGESLLKVDEDGTSRVHNHGDGELAVKGQRGAGVKVGKAKGRKVKKGKRPEKPVPLPPTPVWKDGVHHFLALPGHLGSIHGSWEKVDTAASYFVEVATDPEGVNVIAAVLVPASIDRFEIRGLAAGDYHVRVAAVDDDQFESLPSTAYAAKLEATRVSNVPGATMRWEADSEGNEHPVFVGAGRVELPAGVSCEFGSGEALVERAATEAPACKNAAGETVAGFPFVVLRPEVAVAGAEAIETVRGRESRHVVDLPDGHGVDSIVATLPVGYELLGLQQREDGDFDLSLRATAGAPAKGEVELRLGSADGPVLGMVPITARDLPSVEPKTTPKKEKHMFELGLGGFGIWMNDEHGLFDPQVGHRSFAGPVGGGRLTLGYNVLGSYALAQAREKPDLAVVVPSDYTLVLTRAAYVPRQAANRADAEAFLEFTQGPQGRRILIEDALLFSPIDGEDELYKALGAGEGGKRAIRPIALGPALIVGLDQMKRRLFLKQWRDSLGVGED